MYSKALALALVFVAGEAAAPALLPLRAATASAAQAQTPVDASDAELARASRGVTIRIGSPARGRDVLTIPLETYVAQVLSAEGEPNAPDAAEQALAIAARTYALFNAGRHRRDGYDLCDTVHCQVMRASTPLTRRAAQATLGLVLTYEGAPADLYYSASCGGRTERGEDVWPKNALPYLESVEDDVHESDPVWTLERTLDEVRDALARAGVRGHRLEDVIVESRTSSGRAGRVGLPGLEPDSMNSNEFRLALGSTDLRSTAFTITRNGDRLTFTGRGYGHGVGMCVIGAGRRAVRGESASQILARYFPGLALEDVSRVLPGVTPLATPALPAPVSAAPMSFPSVSPVPPVPLARNAPAVPALPATKSPALVVRVPPDSPVTALELERLTREAQEKLSSRLGLAAAPLTVQLHPTIDAFRRATSQPWWVSSVVRGASLDLAPAAVLDQRDGFERSLQIAVAEALLGPELASRPAWVAVGAARYFTAARPPEARDGRLRCPADAELTAAVSAGAQRDADARATACFAQSFARTQDWRAIR